MSKNSVGARNADGSAVELTDDERAKILAKHEARDIVASLEGIIEKHHSHDEEITALRDAVLLLSRRVIALELRQTPEKYNENSNP